MSKSPYSLTVDGVEISGHASRDLAAAKAEKVIRNPNQVATIQDLYPTGKPGAKVCIVWRRMGRRDWIKHRFHTIPGEKAKAKPKAKAKRKPSKKS